MEEILASIRRIIEESDTTRPDDVPPVPVNSDIPSRAATREPHSADRPGDEEAELPPREGIAVAAPAPASFESPLGRSSSPLQSKLVEQESAQDTPLRAESLERQVAEAPSQQIASRPAETFENASRADTAPKVSPEEQAALPEDEAAAEWNPPVFEMEAVELAATRATAPADLAGTEPEASMDDVSLDLERALEPILSEATERQVSSAFDDLSFAVRNEQRRSFDEIAQEIMRPLLQDWLDNNLPTLVERLVREEIERVARGGRR